MNPFLEYHLHQTRRQFFAGAGLSLGGLRRMKDQARGEIEHV